MNQIYNDSILIDIYEQKTKDARGLAHSAEKLLNSAIQEAMGEKGWRIEQFRLKTYWVLGQASEVFPFNFFQKIVI